MVYAHNVASFILPVFHFFHHPRKDSGQIPQTHTKAGLNADQQRPC